MFFPRGSPALSPQPGLELQLAPSGIFASRPISGGGYFESEQDIPHCRRPTQARTAKPDGRPSVRLWHSVRRDDAKAKLVRIALLPLQPGMELRHFRYRCVITAVSDPAGRKRTLQIFFLGVRVEATPVDSRITNSGRTGTASGKLSVARILCSKMRAATVPIYCIGWRIVVRLGL